MSVFLSSESESESTSDSGSSTPAPAPARGDLEFRCSNDDAWYNARFVLDGEKLTVKYLNFSDEDDEMFSAAEFRSLSDLKEFGKRVRPVSPQLQDRECGKVVQGTVVCAALSLADADIRFFDGVVDDVIYKEHSFADGEEECMCTFIVVWLHGPRANFFENRRIEHLCLVQSGRDIDPAVPLFFDLVTRRLGGDSCTRQLLLNQETESGERHSARIYPSGERLITFSERNAEDVDFGGEDAHQLLLIDNIDKELLPSTLTKFIHRETSVSAEAYIFPSLSSEIYTRGLIFLHSKKDLQKLNEFFTSPSHIVVSYRGRPWVLRDTFSGSDAFKMPDRRLMLECQCKLHLTSNAADHVLKVVRIGTKEYDTAKQLKDLFMEFAKNQRQVHKSLAREERLILDASSGV